MSEYLDEYSYLRNPLQAIKDKNVRRKALNAVRQKSAKVYQAWTKNAANMGLDHRQGHDMVEFYKFLVRLKAPDDVIDSAFDHMGMKKELDTIRKELKASEPKKAPTPRKGLRA